MKFCISFVFFPSKIDFKTGDERRISKILPSTIYDNTTELIYLDKDDPMFDLSGKVPKSGPYVFVVHYYQPDFPGKAP